MTKRAPQEERPLTNREKRFVDEYLIDLNATRAARAAGYVEVPYTKLKKGPVSRAIQEAMDRRARNTAVRSDLVLLEVKRLASIDPLDLFDADGSMRAIAEIPEDLRRCIASFEVEEIWAGKGDDRERIGTLKKVKLWSKDSALDKLMRHLSLYKDKLELTGTVTLRDLLPAAAGGLGSAEEEDPAGGEAEDEEPTLDEELYGGG